MDTTAAHATLTEAVEALRRLAESAMHDGHITHPPQLAAVMNGLARAAQEIAEAAQHVALEASFAIES